MAQLIRIGRAAVAVRGADKCSVLAAVVNASEPLVKTPKVDLELSSQVDGLHLQWNQASHKPLFYHLDFVAQARRLRSFPAPKQGAFNQALGKRTKTVLDATGGWGDDALRMCLQGYQVVVLERQRLMAAMITEAFERLAVSDWAVNVPVSIPHVINADAITVMDRTTYTADCVYLDPMFPPKTKQAAVNKKMQLLQWLLEQDKDAAELVTVALRKGYPRIAVKRPDYADPLLGKPHAQFHSKLVHYDVYINKPAAGQRDYS